MQSRYSHKTSTLQDVGVENVNVKHSGSFSAFQILFTMVFVIYLKFLFSKMNITAPANWLVICNANLSDY